jgi:uncharacterized membrane protein
VYKLKVKVFFGSLKASKVSLFLLLFYSLSMVPGIVGIVISSVTFVKETADLLLYTNTLSAVISGLLALNLVSTYRGITAFEYEQSFVFTSPVTPRQFLIASLLADGTFSLLFLFPLPLILATMVFSLNLSAIATSSIFISSLLFFLFSLFLRSSCSILGVIFKNTWLKVLTTLLIVLLLFPAISLFAPTLVNYDTLPYPTTFMAQIILRSLSNKTASTVSLFGFSFYFLMSLALFYLSSKMNFFQFASSAPLISAFDMSMGMQTRKVDMNIRLFSRVGLKIALTSESKSLLTFLMKKEFIRILRDGSLFVIVLLYAIISVISVVGSARGMPMPIWLFLLVLYSFIIPPILVGNWRVVEMKSLWIPLTSDMNLRYLAESTLYVFTIIASTVPVAVISALTFINRIDPLIPLVLTVSVSMIGCSVNLYVVMRFLGKGSRATPSIIISWIALLMTGLLLSPVYAFMVFNLLSNFSLVVRGALSVLSLAYSTVIFILLSKTIGKKASSIELWTDV